MELKPGIRYVVTKAPVRGTLQLGDTVRLEKNGDLMCCQAGGWIEARSVKRVSSRCKFALDWEYYEAKRNRLENELLAVHALMREFAGEDEEGGR